MPVTIEPKLCLIGQACVDVTVGTLTQQAKLRLGGILHPARALWALDVPYHLAYIAPSYLANQITDYAQSHGTTAVSNIGVVQGSPNVILIQDPKEVGNQGYEFLLRDEHQCTLNDIEVSKALGDESITDFVIFPGGFDLKSILTALAPSTARVYIDVAYGVDDLDDLSSLGRKFDVIASSTSSDLFLRRYSAKVHVLCHNLLKQHSEAVLFKENRGGARFFRRAISDTPVRVEAQVRSIKHSVGVGDCFNVIYAAQRYKHNDETALAYASWCAAEYASTTYVDDFKRACRRVLSVPPEEVTQIEGISLPWEDRQLWQVYIAAPDFDFVDRTHIDRIAESLRYHNFVPRLPVRENGQMEKDASPSRKQQICDADLQVLNECQMLLAVLVNDDAGTMIEIGLAVEKGMPVIVYDPHNRAENLMLTQLPSLVSANLDDVISAVFRHASKRMTPDA